MRLRPPTEATLLGFRFFTSRFTLPHPAGDQGTVARSYVRASVAVCARAWCRGTLRLPSLRATGAALRGRGENVTKSNRPPLVSELTITFHWHGPEGVTVRLG